MNRQFHVYIIESPAPPDLYLKRFEGEALCSALRLSGISASHVLTVNFEAFTAAFYVGLVEYFQNNNLQPIIHISAHGSRECIQLTSGEVVTWESLRTFLRPLNKALESQGGFLLSMSSCNGASSCVMAMKDDEYPFWGVVGNLDKPTWSETNIGFSSFYHLFANGKSIDEAVEGMKAASGNMHFTFIEANTARKAYLDVIKQQSVELLENSIPPEESRELEKALS